MRTRQVVLGLAAVLLLIAGLLPLLVMCAKSITIDGRVSLAHYRDLLASGRPWMLMAHSLALASLTTLCATAIGLPLGILFSKTDLPLGRVFAALFTIPLLAPPYITAVAWFDLLGQTGLVGRAWLFGLPGCVLVLTSTFLPVVMLLTMTYLGAVNPGLEEAGRLVAGWPRVLRRITIPLIRPGLLLAAVLVFLLAMGEFGVPTYLRYGVFPVESFTQFSAFYNFGAATAAAMPLALVTLVFLAFERRFGRERTCQLQPVSSSERPPAIALGRARGWALALVGWLCLVLVIAPLSMLVWQSLSGGAYLEAFSRAGGSLLRSLAYAALGASLLALVGFLAGYSIHTRALPFWRALDSLTLFLFALPGAVIGIGLIALWNRPATNFIYATPAIILLGYLAQYSALTSRITVAALAQVPPSMEEAAQVLGAGWLRRTSSIVAPLAKRGLAAGWLVAYIFCLRDMGISMLVYPPGHDTFPVRIFTLMANGSESLIAALCVLMLAATLLPLGLLSLGWRAHAH